MRSSGKAYALGTAMLLAAGLSPVLRAQIPAPAPSTSTALSTIRAVRRDVLPEAVRITVELDREVPFYQERLDNPSRVFLDLGGTNTVPSLVDAVFKYDTDVVREIRLGRPQNKTTRLVVDLAGVSRFSVYTLYSPYRIVIDCERESSEKRCESRDQPLLPELSGDLISQSTNGNDRQIWIHRSHDLAHLRKRHA